MWATAQPCSLKKRIFSVACAIKLTNTFPIILFYAFSSTYIWVSMVRWAEQGEITNSLKILVRKPKRKRTWGTKVQMTG
jgi:hypothetical protein